ncbi:MAG: cytochrome ubiquinol oxidase subunit I [Oceanococcus sp.]
MDPLALLLSRIQFGFTIGYHILFPTLSMGLAMFLLIVEALELKTGRSLYRQIGIFWSRIFALSFGMGVVSGVVLSYEIGTNFGVFSEKAGPVIGPLMSYEVMSAFFLEAGFLGIMLLGRHRVGPRVHFFATAMVALGTLMSAFWILSANSFMHTPAGYGIAEDGSFFVESWLAVIFNPSFPYRFAHMVTATWLTTSFVIAGVGAWFVLQQKHHEVGAFCLRFGIAAAAILAPTQILIGDLHGLNTLQHQPMKVAAMEGHWETSGDVPLLLFAWPDQEAEKNHFEIAIPYVTSLILTHDPHGVVQGLKEVPADERPPVAPVFFTFRLMVGCGFLMLGLAGWGVIQWLRGRLNTDRRLHQMLLLCSPIGFIAVLAGWMTTEIGRQPWIVQGLMRTADAGSAVNAASVAISLSAFVVTYAVLFVAFLIFFRHLVRKGPDQDHSPTTLPAQGEARPAFMTVTEGQ